MVAVVAMATITEVTVIRAIEVTEFIVIVVVGAKSRPVEWENFEAHSSKAITARFAEVDCGGGGGDVVRIKL